MRYNLILIAGLLFCAPLLKAQTGCKQTLPISTENINKVFAALGDLSIRGTSIESKSTGFTEWLSAICMDGQTKDGSVYSSSRSDGVKFTFLENGKEKEANKLFDKLGELLDNSKPSGWVDELKEFKNVDNVYYFLRDQDPNKTKEVRLKLEKSFGKYSVFIWFEVYH